MLLSSIFMFSVLAFPALVGYGAYRFFISNKPYHTKSGCPLPWPTLLPGLGFFLLAAGIFILIALFSINTVTFFENKSLFIFLSLLFAFIGSMPFVIGGVLIAKLTEEWLIAEGREDEFEIPMASNVIAASLRPAMFALSIFNLFKGRRSSGNDRDNWTGGGGSSSGGGASGEF